MTVAAEGRSLAEIETPSLVLDRDRLDRNCRRMRERCRDLGVRLRPHLKTAKSLDVARVALGPEPGPITVSTLKEAEYFADGGYRDILVAATLTPAKFARAARIQGRTGACLLLVVDSEVTVAAAERAAGSGGAPLSLLVEIDCGEHRTGIPAGDPEIVRVAEAVDRAPHLRLAGVMTHAGHSYGSDDPEAVRDIARHERDAAVGAAVALRAAGLACGIVSIGSTPTILFADHLEGVTEARCGIYMVWDLAQLSRGMCREEDLALSVLATVIGHNRSAGSLVLDAGALALSKDVTANRFAPAAHYGVLCCPDTLARCGNLAVDVVHQEHGTVMVADPAWFDHLPVGAPVRILPNHACLTGAGYPEYQVVSGARVVGRWERINGW